MYGTENGSPVSLWYERTKFTSRHVTKYADSFHHVLHYLKRRSSTCVLRGLARALSVSNTLQVYLYHRRRSCRGEVKGCHWKRRTRERVGHHII
jgi:hypothetical protein